MSISNAQPIELVLKGTIERIDILVTDANGDPIDATALTLQVFNSADALIIQDDFFNGYGDPATPPTQIVKPTSTTGQYYFPFGDTSFDAANSTVAVGDYLFRWSVTGATGTETVNIVQVANVVSPRTMRMLPYFRLLIDKSAKAVDDNPEDPVYLGYTDPMLIAFLENGLSLINAFQPTVGWGSIDEFPELHRQVLLDAALVVGLTSQELYAVDTDVVYSDQGTSFSIQHQPMLASVLTTIWQRLSTMVPLMKRQYWTGGGIHIQAGPSYRLAQMIASAPPGSSFRNLFVA